MPLKVWNEAIVKLSEMKMHLQRYQQILQVPADQKCLCTLITYKEELIDQINTLWKDIILIDDVVNELFEDADEQNLKYLNIIKQFFDYCKEIKFMINKQNDPSESIDITEAVLGMMIYLLPSVAKLS